MHKFQISIRSFDQLEHFIRLAMCQPFQVLVGEEQTCIRGFMGMFTLDFQRPLQISVLCTEEEYQAFRQQLGA